jgi:Carboxypeptidase regulatory-like domain
MLSDGRLDLSRESGKLTLVLGTDMGEVEGTVKHASGEPAARVRVTVIPYGSKLGNTELSRFAFTEEDGTYVVKDVAPGEYKVFAWEDVPIGAPQDPEYRKPFENSGTAIKLESNGKATVPLTAIVTND